MTVGLLLVFLLAIPGYGPATEIVVGVGDHNGSALGLSDGKFTGTLAKLFQCPFDKTGLRFDLRLLPQVRNLYLLEKGEIDIALPLTRVSRRADYAIFTRKMAEIPFILYTSRDFDFSGDISSYKFAVMRGSASVDLVMKRNARFEEVTSWVQALKLAQLGRYDGAVIPAPVIGNVDPKLLEGVKKWGFGASPMSLYVSRKSPHAAMLVERLNAAIATCQG